MLNGHNMPNFLMKSKIWPHLGLLEVFYNLYDSLLRFRFLPTFQISIFSRFRFWKIVSKSSISRFRSKSTQHYKLEELNVFDLYVRMYVSWSLFQYLRKFFNFGTRMLWFLAFTKYIVTTNFIIGRTVLNDICTVFDI